MLTLDPISIVHSGPRSLLASPSILLQDNSPLCPKLSTDVFTIQYLGLHPYIVKNSVTKAAGYANAARAVGSAVFGTLAGFSAEKATTPTAPPPTTPNTGTSNPAWGKWAAPAAYTIGGAILAGAAAGGAYYKRENLSMGLTWATDHMKYVGNLWDEETLKRRIEALINVEEQAGVVFRT